ncbi:MAG: class I SAM-dependent methyltransferase, partial [Pseudomonadota bacterium]|nr:class I SAM-dependent methyltransferase [Pseudomonadota bacterium]
MSPLSRQVLRVESPHSLAAPGERWPVVDGIPYLRTNRDVLVADALFYLDEGRPYEALALLLGDQDDWARTPPASLEERRRVVADAGRISFREAMDRLAFGGVGTYFAHRWSDPTFLSGLALAEAHWTQPGRVFELACGAGHFLREFARFCPDVAGADVVFAKLWLARRFVAPQARLICFDAAGPWPLPDRATDLLFCHDAFYFLPEKPHVAAEMRRVAAGPILVGHAHNALVDNLSSGAPLAPGQYAALFDAPRLYDDAILTGALLGGIAPAADEPGGLASAAAISLASHAPAPRPVIGGLAMPAPGAPLRRNPLYRDGLIDWPSPRYQTEYGPLASYP